MSVRTFSLDGQLATAEAEQSLLKAAQAHGVEIPTLCHLDGLSTVGACRLCIVEIEGYARPQPACTTLVQEGMVVVTRSTRLEHYRRTILELLFAERNHVCSVCVSNNHCELQAQAHAAGMNHVRFPYQSPQLPLDASHDRFVVDHNRCILCTRCVRVCGEIEGAHTWGLIQRGPQALVATDLAEPWGEAASCTSCGKCVEVCPTGALFDKDATAGGMIKHPEFLKELLHARRPEVD